MIQEGNKLDFPSSPDLDALSKTCSGQFSLTRDKSNDCVVSPMYVPSISKPILFILQCKTTLCGNGAQWVTS